MWLNKYNTLEWTLNDSVRFKCNKILLCIVALFLPFINGAMKENGWFTSKQRAVAKG